jgi:hypothetical protein
MGCGFIDSASGGDCGFFLAPFLPSRERPAPPVYVVDLVGGEKIGGLKLGTEISTPAQSKPKIEPSKQTVPEPKKEAPGSQS